jgi:putative ABC transport system ATP-binding protein
VKEQEAIMQAQKIIVETEELVKEYGGGVRALDHINLFIAEGEFVAVMGPSGSGKSTLLHMIAALDRPTAGSIRIDGQDLSSIKDADYFRSRTVGIVFQLHNLIPALSALENVLLPAMPIHMSGRARRERGRELLLQVDLREKENALPGELSGGERQRVAIARALMNRPRLLLADEPTGNLDTHAGAEIMNVFRNLNAQQGVTILVVTHDPTVARTAKRMLHLVDGKIVRDERVGDPYIQDLREFKDSGLGKAVLRAAIPASIEELGLRDNLLGMRAALAEL